MAHYTAEGADRTRLAGNLLVFRALNHLVASQQSARGDLGSYSRLTSTRVGGTNVDATHGHAFSSWRQAVPTPAQGFDGPDNCRTEVVVLA
jgi:hypothetical protein